MRVKLYGKIHAYYVFKDGVIDLDDLTEGDIRIQPKLDIAGRIAAQGRHANMGYERY